MKYAIKKVGIGYTTLYPTFDFETKSPAGYKFTSGKYVCILKNKAGIKAVGAAKYSEHPDTAVLSLSYDLCNGEGCKLWLPSMPPPMDLFNYIKYGGILEAHNCIFEYFIWLNVCEKRMGWPPLKFNQLRDSAAKGAAMSYPVSLENLGKALKINKEKFSSGKNLIRRFCIPRSPTKNDPRHWIDPLTDEKGIDFYRYNIRDVEAEQEASGMLPDLSDDELKVWQMSQDINIRGVKIDTESLYACIKMYKHFESVYTAELRQITNKQVKTAAELKKMLAWLKSSGYSIKDLTAPTIEAELEKLKDEPYSDVKRILEIRQMLSSNSVKKLFAIECRLCNDNRLRDLFLFCGALHTGRYAGRGPQPQNLPSGGPLPSDEWTTEEITVALGLIKNNDYDEVLRKYKDPIKTISGCLRGLFCADEGKDLISSDYKAIEAVVLAAIAKEQWRLDVFNSHGMIYEMSASKISGVPFEEFVTYKKQHGSHHPLRKKIGKVAELASGYQGGYGAWCRFGADKLLSEIEIKNGIKKWREESPNIVNLWKQCEDNAKLAIQNPGSVYKVNEYISYGVKDNVLYCQLPSGRTIKYVEPELKNNSWMYNGELLTGTKITYNAWNSDYTKGSVGWLRIDTYGGKLVENIVQAISRDILVYAMIKLEAAGYPIVLHVHDEIIAEIIKGFGSIQEFENIMADVPPYAKSWPIKAAGGWIGSRFRKD